MLPAPLRGSIPRGAVELYEYMGLANSIGPFVFLR